LHVFIKESEKTKREFFIDWVDWSMTAFAKL